MKRPHVRSERRNRLAHIRARRRDRHAVWAVCAWRGLLRDMVAERLLNDAIRAAAAQWALAFPSDDRVTVCTINAPEAT